MHSVCAFPSLLLTHATFSVDTNDSFLFFSRMFKGKGGFLEGTPFLVDSYIVFLTRHCACAEWVIVVIVCLPVSHGAAR